MWGTVVALALGRQTAIDQQLAISVPKSYFFPRSLPVLKAISIRYLQVPEKRT